MDPPLELDALLPLCVASAGAPSPAPCLAQLHAASCSGALRDADPACVASLAPAWAQLLHAALSPAVPAASTRFILESFAAAVDCEEWGGAVKRAVGAAPCAGGAACARAVACAQRTWENAQRGVFGTALSLARAADEVQPRGGVLGGGRAAAPPAAAPPDAAPPQAPTRRGPLRAPFDELRALRGLLAWLWLHFPRHRGTMERGVERLLRAVGRDAPPEAGAAAGVSLQLAGAVCAGGCSGSLFSARTAAEGARLLALLAPLLGAPGGAGGVGSVLALYFEPLSALLRGLAAAHGGALLPSAFDAVAFALTAALSESAARAELLLTLLRSLAGAWAAAWAGARGVGGSGGGGAPLPLPPPPLPPDFLPRLVLPLVADENSRLAQAALAFFSEPAVCAWCAAACEGGAHPPPLLLAAARALLRGTLHWNPTVNKHTHAALCALRAAARAEGCEVQFLEAADALCGGSRGGGGGTAAPASAAPGTAAPAGAAPAPPREGGITTAAPQPPLAALRQAVGGAVRGALPPLRGVGVGVGGSGGWHPASGAPPPVTITGVAPWAAAAGAGVGVSARAAASVAAANESARAAAALRAPAPATQPPSSPFEARLASLLPPAPPPAPPPAQDALPPLPPPLRLEPAAAPLLAFHDLVFGEELGRGSFSTVRAARHIQRGAGAPPRAAWPAYAVKVLTAATLRSAAYRPAARREAAVLRALRHPATTRLASAFQWRGGVYLVLEHASGGDLHELLAAVGPLPEDTARFLLGEVAAALMHVHALGFAFGDCKPENVVLVAPPGDGGGDDAASWAAAGGLHAKLADFAACRPISTAGAAVLAEGRGALRTLRSGDWRHGAGGGVVEPAPAAAAAAESSGSDSEGSDDGAEDNRIEGTPEYLAPELQGGASLPTVASDAYAFGVTLFQALVGGRLPDVGSLWPAQGGGGQGVRWAAPGAAEGGSCGGGFPPGFPAAAAPLVRALLHPDAAQRLGGGPRGFEEVVEHPWFAALGCGVDKLFRERGPADPRQEGGGALQRADPQWARRHASMMWAPSLAAARALRLAGAEGAGVGGALGPPRAAAQLRLAELMALAALPPLAFEEESSPPPPTPHTGLKCV